MFDILKKEWKVYLNKNLLMMLLFMMLGGIVGIGALKLILFLEPESTYIYLGTIISIYVAGIYMFVIMAGVINTRLNLIISFGGKRSSVIWYSVAVTVLTALVSYVLTMIIFFLEKNIYSLVYASNGLEVGFGMGILVKYGLLIYVFVAILLWFLYALSLRYGGKCFAIAYLAFMAILMVVPRLAHANVKAVTSMLSVLAKIFMSITVAGWIAAGIVASVLMVISGFKVLKGYDVRY